METAICEKCKKTYPVDIGCVTCRPAGKPKEAPKETAKKDADKK